jgi:beta-N-acetylhexosaminidase
VFESLSVEDQRLLLNPNVCGVILFARNYSSKRQLIDLTQHIKSISPQMLIGVDQEGGRVQRFQTDFVRLPSMQILGDMLSRSNESAINFIRDVGWLMATELRSCFVDFSFAPVIDVDRFRSSVIGDRSFSENPDIVSLAAEAFINGIHDAGLPCVGKHFPGHGSVAEDSHIEHPMDYRSLEEIALHDLLHLSWDSIFEMALNHVMLFLPVTDNPLDALYGYPLQHSHDQGSVSQRTVDPRHEYH